MTNIGIKKYWEANFPTIKKNWIHEEHIRLKNHSDVSRYVLDILQRLRDLVLQPSTDFNLGDVADSLFIWAIGLREVWGDNAKIKRLEAIRNEFKGAAHD